MTNQKTHSFVLILPTNTHIFDGISRRFQEYFLGLKGKLSMKAEYDFVGVKAIFLVTSTEIIPRELIFKMQTLAENLKLQDFFVFSNHNNFAPGDPSHFFVRVIKNEKRSGMVVGIIEDRIAEWIKSGRQFTYSVQTLGDFVCVSCLSHELLSKEMVSKVDYAIQSYPKVVSIDY